MHAITTRLWKHVSRGPRSISRLLTTAVRISSLALISCNGCNAATRHVQFISKPSLQGNRYIGEVRVGSGTACYVNGSIGPPSYAARGISSPGAPKLMPSELAMLHKILKFVHPNTLRYAFVGGEFIVYDARGGPCASENYFVLNGDCNEFYSPTDDFSGTRAGTGCWNPPRPWIPNDRGTGKGSWNRYPNND